MRAMLTSSKSSALEFEFIAKCTVSQANSSFQHFLDSKTFAAFMNDRLYIRFMFITDGLYMDGRRQKPVLQY